MSHRASQYPRREKLPGTLIAFGQKYLEMVGTMGVVDLPPVTNESPTAFEGRRRILRRVVNATRRTMRMNYQRSQGKTEEGKVSRHRDSRESMQDV